MLAIKIASLFAFAVSAVSAAGTITCAAGEHIAYNANQVPVCVQCPKGTYQPVPTTGSAPTTCTDCPAGMFTSVRGSKTCCKCCEGFYQNSSGANNCKACTRGDGGLFSAAGSTSSTACGDYVPGMNGAGNTCAMSGDSCPSTTASGPQGSPVKRKRDLGCARGFAKCQRLHGTASFDCVDVANDPESCGGCLFEENPLKAGVDCTALPGVSVVDCKVGACHIVRCRKGYKKSEDGSACVPVRMHVQERSL